MCAEDSGALNSESYFKRKNQLSKNLNSLIK